MKKLKLIVVEHYRQLLLLLIGTCILYAFLVVPFLLGEEAFLIGADAKMQYLEFHELLESMIHVSIDNKVLPFYSFTQFLGNNFYSSRLFLNYDLFDYFFSLLRLSYFNSQYIGLLLRMLVGVFSFYALSQKLGWKKVVSVLFSFIYITSSWALFNIKDPFLYSFYCFVPIYFLTIERFFYDNKKVGFIIAVAYMAIDNYYMFYTTSLFTILYFLYRYRMIRGDYKGWLLTSFRLIGFYLVGVLIAGFALIPSFIYILGNDRVGSSNLLLLFDNIKPYLQIFSGLFNYSGVLGNRGIDFNPSMLHLLELDRTIIYLTIQSSMFVSLLYFQSLSCHSKNYKINRVYSFITILMLAIPLLSSMMHGFSAANFRWSFLAIILILIMAGNYLSESVHHNKSVIIKTMIIGSVISISSLVVASTINGELLAKEVLYSLIGVLFIILFGILLIRNISMNKLGIVVMIELCLVSYLSMYDNPSYRQYTKEEIKRYQYVLLENNDLENYLNNLDNSNVRSFYRVYVPYNEIAWSISLNFNHMFGYKPLMGYDSTYAFAINDLDNITNIRGTLDWMFQIEDRHLIDFLSTKYAVVTNESQLPHNNFEYRGEFNYLLVYENVNYINLGKSYNRVISYDKYLEAPNTELLDGYIIVDKENVGDIEKLVGTKEVAQFISVDVGVNKINATIEMKEKGFVVTSIPYDDGFKIIVNESEVIGYAVNGGFLGFEAEVGINEVGLYFIPRGLKLGLASTGAGVVLLICIIIKRKGKSNDKI